MSIADDACPKCGPYYDRAIKAEAKVEELHTFEYDVEIQLTRNENLEKLLKLALEHVTPCVSGKECGCLYRKIEREIE